MTKAQDRLGDLTKEDINFPKHLTAKIIHTALFLYNAPPRQFKSRVRFCAKEIGDNDMSYAMALLVLPKLVDNMQGSPEYKEWKEQHEWQRNTIVNKTIH